MPLRPRPPAIVALTVVLAAWLASAAATSIELNDGQIINGTAVDRQGDVYLVTMKGGTKVAFPVALVKEVRFVDEVPTPPAPGMDVTPPKTLAGPEVKLNQDPKDQLKALGPPATWIQDVIDPTWYPTSAYDPNKDVLASSRATWSKSAVDTTWVPKSAYDLNKDVLANSRATWSKSAVDTTWTPTDGWGFKSLWPARPGPPTQAFVPPPAAGEAAGSDAGSGAHDLVPWTCAERFFAGDGGRKTASVNVEKVTSPLYASLGMTLYEATGTLGGSSRKAIFTISNGECRLLGGDTDALIGLNLPQDHAMSQNVASFNAAIAAGGGARVPPGVDKVGYALAFVSLTDPGASGVQRASLDLIAKPEQLRSIIAKVSENCSLPKGRRHREEHSATSGFAPPKVVAGREGDIVTFLTWSANGGILYRNTVVLTRSGVISSKRDVVASHLGAHRDANIGRDLQ